MTKKGCNEIITEANTLGLRLCPKKKKKEYASFYHSPTIMFSQRTMLSLLILQ